MCLVLMLLDWVGVMPMYCSFSISQLESRQVLRIYYRITTENTYKVSDWKFAKCTTWHTFQRFGFLVSHLIKISIYVIFTDSAINVVKQYSVSLGII